MRCASPPGRAVRRIGGLKSASPQRDFAVSRKSTILGTGSTCTPGAGLSRRPARLSLVAPRAAWAGQIYSRFRPACLLAFC